MKVPEIKCYWIFTNSEVWIIINPSCAKWSKKFPGANKREDRIDIKTWAYRNSCGPMVQRSSSPMSLFEYETIEAEYLATPSGSRIPFGGQSRRRRIWSLLYVLVYLVKCCSSTKSTILNGPYRTLWSVIYAGTRGPTWKCDTPVNVSMRYSDLLALCFSTKDSVEIRCYEFSMTLPIRDETCFQRSHFDKEGDQISLLSPEKKCTIILHKIVELITEKTAWLCQQKFSWKRKIFY